jgi:hypothetical protein
MLLCGSSTETMVMRVEQCEIFCWVRCGAVLGGVYTVSGCDCAGHLRLTQISALVFIVPLLEVLEVRLGRVSDALSSIIYAAAHHVQFGFMR